MFLGWDEESLTPWRMMKITWQQNEPSPSMVGQHHLVFQRGIAEQRSFARLGNSISSQVCQQLSVRISCGFETSTAVNAFKWRIETFFYSEGRRARDKPGKVSRGGEMHARRDPHGTAPHFPHHPKHCWFLWLGSCCSLFPECFLYPLCPANAYSFGEMRLKHHHLLCEACSPLPTLPW